MIVTLLLVAAASFVFFLGWYLWRRPVEAACRALYAQAGTAADTARVDLRAPGFEQSVFWSANVTCGELRRGGRL